MKKIITIAVFLICLVLVGGYIYIKNHIMDGPGMVYEPKLQSFEYYFAGDMIASYERFEVKKEKGSYYVIHEYTPSWNEEKKVEQKEVDVDLLLEIEHIFYTYHLEKDVDAPESEYYTLDAGIAHYSYIFEDQTFDYNDLKDYQKDTNTGLRETYTLLKNQFE